MDAPRSSRAAPARTGTRPGRRVPGWPAWPTALIVGLVLAALLLQQSGVQAQNGETHAPGPSDHIARDVILVVLLIIVNGLFAMAEAAFLSVRRTRVEQMVEEGNRAAHLVERMLSDPTRMLATLQVGVTLISLFSAGAAAESAVGPLSHFLSTHLAGTALAPYAYRIAFFTVIMGVALLTLVIGEIAPKSVAIRYAERISLVAAGPIRVVQIVFAPAVAFVQFLSGLIVRPFGVTAGFHPSALSEDELRMLVEQSEEHGVIETEEKEMIHSIFDFADTLVRKVMTPRLDVTAIEADADTEDLIQAVTASGHSRLPVYDDNLDNIVGIVHVKDLLRGCSQSSSERPSIREVMRPAYFIPENKRVDDLLHEFRRSKTQLAVVRDEYGTMVGVVTIEDLLEEIVGDIQDEYDPEERPLVQQVDDRTSIIDGRMTLEDFNERMGTELPIEESDTLGGFVFGLLGHQPAQGESAHWDGMEFGVEETDGRRIQRIRVVKDVVVDADQNDGTGPADRGETGPYEPSSASQTAAQGPPDARGSQ